MPYYHVGCGGKIHFWRRKCTKCNNQWPLSVLFMPTPPHNMKFVLPKIPVPEIQKGKTSYAGWADKFPGAGTLASWLPNWPRWARVTLVSGLLVVIVLVILLVKGVFSFG